MKLIFIHGAGNTGEVWHYQVEHFVNSEAVYLPGHLAAGELRVTVEDYSDWLYGYIAEHKYSDPIIIGHSLGGAIAQIYALKYPRDIKALILVGSGARLRVAPQVLSLIRYGIKSPSAWFEDFVKPSYSQIDSDVRERIIRKIAQLGAAVQLNDMLCCDAFDIMDRVHRVKTPTLILCGSEDQMTPPKYGSYLTKKIEGSEFITIEGGSHLVFTEKPEVFNQAIEQFLMKL